MNGIDSICALITAGIILLFIPLWQFETDADEFKKAVLNEMVKNDGEDTDLIIEAGEILGTEVKGEEISFEWQRNAPLYPYIFIRPAEEGNSGAGGEKVFKYGY